MISFNKPTNLNGEQLCNELEAAGITVNRSTSPLIHGDNPDFLWLDIDSANTKKAEEVLNAHVPQTIKEPTVAEKLASVGLNLDDLKAALGL